MRYDKNIIYKTSDGKRYYKGKIYPNIPYSETDEYVITTIGDRLDSIAYRYYGDSELWWVISVANNNITNGSMFPTPGIQLRVPLNIGDILQQFDQINNL
jgi:phage tail protein X